MKAEAAAGKGTAEEAVIHRIRITLTSRYVYLPLLESEASFRRLADSEEMLSHMPQCYLRGFHQKRFSKLELHWKSLKCSKDSNCVFF